MNGLRSVTLWTFDIKETESFYKDILGLNTLMNHEKNILHIGDANLAPGTRLIFKQYSGDSEQLDTHFHGIALRVPTDYALYEYKQQFDNHQIKYESVQQLNGKHLFKFLIIMDMRYILFLMNKILVYHLELLMMVVQLVLFIKFKE